MLRDAPGVLRMKPLRSRVRIIWCTVGGVTPKNRLNVALGRRLPVDADIGVDERQILALLGGEAGCGFARHLIHQSIHLGLHDGGCDECTISRQTDQG